MNKNSTNSHQIVIHHVVRKSNKFNKDSNGFGSTFVIFSLKESSLIH